ncbi:hypothetical protein NQ317_012643 [Molorchus minor]|uniref:Uncharacterized protein n=1 Tax=Molorchus minor TaxID=1323400 RepID=A0ABQ9J2F4_9CUCU|nr:hypothetical protein NQ317_012643 [Molorchus minor]
MYYPWPNCFSLESVEENVIAPAWYSLIQNLPTNKLQLLKALFKEKTKDKLQEIGLNREEFLSIMCTLFENTNYSLQSLILFDEIAKGSKKTIVWNDMLDFLMENLILTEEPNIRMFFHRMERVPHIKVK